MDWKFWFRSMAEFGFVFYSQESLESTIWSPQFGANSMNTVPTVFSCLEKPFAAIVRLSGCKRKLDRMVRAYPERDLLAFKNSLLKKPERQSFKMVSLCIWLLNFRWCSRMMLFEWCCSSKLYRLEVFECALVLSSSLWCVPMFSDVLWCTPARQQFEVGIYGRTS